MKTIARELWTGCLAVLVLIALSIPASAAAAPWTFHPVANPTPSWGGTQEKQALVVGAEGDFWFLAGGHSVERFTPAGEEETFTTTGGYETTDIAANPSGGVVFSSSAGGGEPTVGTISAQGEIVEHGLPVQVIEGPMEEHRRGKANPGFQSAVVAGPDGSILVAGVTTEWSVEATGCGPTGGTTERLYRVEPTGEITVVYEPPVAKTLWRAENKPPNCSWPYHIASSMESFGALTRTPSGDFVATTRGYLGPTGGVDLFSPSGLLLSRTVNFPNPYARTASYTEVEPRDNKEEEEEPEYEWEYRFSIAEQQYVTQNGPSGAATLGPEGAMWFPASGSLCPGLVVFTGESGLGEIPGNPSGRCLTRNEAIRVKVPGATPEVVFAGPEAAVWILGIWNGEPALVRFNRAAGFEPIEVKGMPAGATIRAAASAGGKLWLLLNNVSGGNEVGYLEPGVAEPPTTVRQPSDSTVTYPAEARFSVECAGEPKPSIRWETFSLADGAFEPITEAAPYEGVSSETLRVQVTSLDQNGGLFEAVCSNAAGKVTSDLATLTVREQLGGPLGITSAKPSKGPAAGGSVVVIGGTGCFAPGSSVTFAGVASPSVQIVSSKELKAVTPPGASGKAAIVVHTPCGETGGKKPVVFEYGAPTVSEVVPAEGPAAGGTRVTIKGSGFATGLTGTKIYFGSAAAKSTTCTDSNECTAVTPKSKLRGTVSVVARVGKLASTGGEAVFAYH